MESLLYNAEIYTMNPAMPRAQAAVWRKGRFAYVGTEEGARLYLGAREHRACDAQGMPVIPGFNDSHMHYVHTVTQARSVDLSGACSVEDVVDRLARGMAARHGEWVIGERWNQERFTQRRLLAREDLDRVSMDVPVIASRACGHIMAANGCALRLAGLSDSGDGILREEEQDAVWRAVPPLDTQTVRQLMRAGQASLLAKGITSVQSDDMGGMEPGEARAFLAWIDNAAREGHFRLRYAAQMRPTSLQMLQAYLGEGLHEAFANAHCRVACVKLMADGSLGARTAWLQGPYHDAHQTRGVSLYSDDTIAALVREAVRHGVPVAAHAIGDAAMEQVLDAYAREGGGLRHAVVHAQITTGAQVSRCGEMGLCILAQPVFLDADAPIVRARVGDALAQSSYRWRTMLGAGAHIAFGTDCPVEPFDPMPGLFCAMTRRTLGGGNPYLPQEAFGLEEALFAYTAAGAYASCEEREKGCIAAGMLADFVILDQPLCPHEPEALLKTSVVRTFVDGECVFEA